jgi:uncharacterized protein YciI
MSVAHGFPNGRRDAKYYLILLNSVPGRPLSAEVVDLHAAHLAQLDSDGKLVLAGPIPDRAGGLIVLRIGSLAEARAIAEEDPLVRGQYQTYEVSAWLLSSRENNYRPNIQPEAGQ